MSSLVVLNPRSAGKDFVASIVFNMTVGTDIFPSSAIVNRTLAEDTDADDVPVAIKATKVSKFSLEMGIFQFDESKNNEKEADPIADQDGAIH